MTEVVQQHQLQHSHQLDAQPPLGGLPSDNQFGFPIEGDDVLLNTLGNLGITDVKEHDLQKPTQQTALACFGAFLELLSFVNDDVVDTLKGACLDRLEHRELYDDSLQIVIRFREIRALMIASCVPDFCLSDITRPKPKRFRKQVFALINFLRFSEHHIHYFDRLKEDNDHIFKERDEASSKLHEVEAQIQREEEERASQEAKTLELRDINAKLNAKLHDLKEEQNTLLKEVEDARQDKNNAHARLTRLIESSRLLHEEIEKLQLRLENTPNELRSMIDKQKRQVKEKRALFAEEEIKAQGMHEKKKVLDALEVDIASCSTIVRACLEEQAKLLREKQELEQVHRDSQDITKERDNLALKLEQTHEKMRFAMERLERIQRNIESKRDDNKRRIEHEADEWNAAQAEKRRRAELVEGLLRNIAELEEEYESVVQSFDAFRTDILSQKQRLEAHSQAYMRAISSNLDLQLDL